MKDWKGNEVMVGHTVVIISTGDMFEGSKLCVLTQTENGFKEVEVADVEKTYTFDVHSRHEITEVSTKVALSMGDRASEIPINMADTFICAMPHQIICIEGISDNEEDYYINYFKE